MSNFDTKTGLYIYNILQIHVDVLSENSYCLTYLPKMRILQAHLRLRAEDRKTNQRVIFTYTRIKVMKITKCLR